MFPPLAQSKYFEHNCIFVKGRLCQNVMFGQGGGRLSKSPKTDTWAQLYYLYCTKAMEIYCICMFYLNEQTICPILTGIHIKCTRYNAYKYTVQNMFLNF